MVYDITDPSAASFVQYANNRDFDIDVAEEGAGDLGPEVVIFIDAKDNPLGKPIVLIANEISGTVTAYVAER